MAAVPESEVYIMLWQPAVTQCVQFYGQNIVEHMKQTLVSIRNIQAVMTKYCQL